MVNKDSRPFLSIEGITHRYGSVVALVDISLSIEEGEFVTLLGPSGCGKTTLLRIVAGFIRATSGRILLEGRDMSHVPAHRRPFNIVFQRPTLFPHLDVFANVAFGLRMKRTARPEIRKRVKAALALVRLEGFEHRRSNELSGGQMQRVCLARALVNSPRLLLLDEPLSALDRKIKLDMQAELRRLHRETGCAFLYVTHDQQEALAMSDRIALLNEGKLEQVGSPSDVFQRPASPFAARFVDANVVPVTVQEDRSGRRLVLVAGHRLPIGSEEAVAAGPGWLVVRPEALRVSTKVSAEGAAIHGTVSDVSYQGTTLTCLIEVPTLATTMKAEVPPDSAPFEIGAEVVISWDTEACRVLPGLDDSY